MSSIHRFEPMRNEVEMAPGVPWLDSVFPFHLELDDSLRIQKAGPSIAKVQPSVLRSGELASEFKIRTPILALTASSIRDHQSSIFILDSLHRNLTLKGQFVYERHGEDGGVLRFLGSPWITELSGLTELGLLLNDFAIHESITDFLFLLQAKNAALLDATRLARKLSEQGDALKASEHRFALAAKAADVGIWDWKIDSNELYFSPRWKSLIGFADDEFPNTFEAWRSHTHPDDVEGLIEQLEEFVRSGGSEFSTEFRMVCKDGGVCWISSRGIALRGEDGRAYRLAGAHSDITARRQAERALQQAHRELELRVKERTDDLVKANEFLRIEIGERMRARQALEEERALLARRVDERTSELQAANDELARAARLKDEFLANMSHELRTPLNAVLGLSEALLEQAYGPLNERQASYIHSIEESGRHLLTLINDILDLSKIEAGRIQFEIGSVLVRNAAEASLRMVKQPAAKKQLNVNLEVPDEQIWVLADERRLKQVLVNLLSNAVKFTPAGGRIGIRAERDAGKKRVRFTVWDTGVGISQEDMSRLFRPFVQLDGGLARRHEGTGLGLVLVRKMAELMNGTTFVESELGKGSRFGIELPESEEVLPRSLAEASASSRPPTTVTNRGDTAFFTSPSPGPSEPPSAQVPPPVEVRSSQRGRILLAEDNEFNIVMLLPYLTRKGYDVTLARNGIQAIEEARRIRPQLILMDIQMPELDGLEAIRRIRADPGLGSTPIFALTALAMPGDRERCLDTGANEYVSKPIRLKLLSELVEHYIGTGRPKQS